MMLVATIKIKDMADACRVSSIADTYAWDIHGVCGRYIIDLKSVLGVLSVGFGKTIDVYLHCHLPEVGEELRHELEDLRVNGE